MKRKVLSGIMNLLVGIVAGFLATIFLKQGIARLFSFGVADYFGFLIPTSTFLSLFDEKRLAGEHQVEW